MKKIFAFLVIGFVLLFVFDGFSQISLDSSIVWTQAVGRVTRIDISPDSKFIAVAMEDGIIKIYSLKSGVFYKELRANNGRIWSVKYSDDGKYLISGGRDFVEYKGDDGLITIWDTSIWDTLKTIRIDYYDGNIFTTISHDNKYLAYSLAQKGIEIIDFNTGKLFKKFPPLPAGHGERQMPNCLDFSKDGRYIAVSAQFNPGRLIDIQNDLNAIIDNCDTWSSAVAISNDGTKFISGCVDNTPNGGVNLIDIQTKKSLGKVRGGTGADDISISPNNIFFTIGGWSRLSIWDINNGKLLATTKLSCEFIKFSPDSNYLVSFTNDRLTLINLQKITDIQENLNSNIPQNTITNTFPNPVNSEVLIEFIIFNPQKIRLSVYDATGKEIKLLINDYYDLGNHQTKWNTSGLPIGEYFVRLASNNSFDVKKIIINR